MRRTGREVVQKKLSEHAKSYSSTKGKNIDFEEFAERVGLASERAKKGRKARSDEGNLLGRPSTSVDLLVDKILISAENGT
jgi:hypothetical protein